MHFRTPNSGGQVNGSEALAVFRQSLGYLAQLRDALETALLHYDEAETLILESRANAERPMNELGRVIAAQGVQLKAMLAGEMGDPKAAYRQLSSLIDFYRKSLPDDDPTLATLRGSIAIILMRDGEHKLAEAILDKSIAILRTTKTKDDPRHIELLVVRGSIRNIANKPEAAHKDLEAALEGLRRLNPKPNLATVRVLDQLGFSLLLIGDLPMARQRLDEAQAMIQAMGGEQATMQASHAMIAGMLALQEKDPKRAASELRLMVETSRRQLTRIAGKQSEREQLGLLQEYRNRFDMYLSAATKEEVDPADLYRELLTWKGAVTYRQGLERTGRDGSDADVRTLLADLQEVDRALAAPGRPGPLKVGELVQRREDLERELLERSAGARKGKERVSRTPADIRSALPDGAVLVDFLQFGQINTDGKTAREWRRQSDITAFVLRKDSDKVARIDLGPARPIAQLIGKWRASYGSGRLPPANEPDPAQALRDLVWKPLKPHLGNARLVFLSPDGPLSALPFQALPGEAPGSFLLEDVSFVIMPVPQRLPDLVSADAVAGGGPTSLLVVGDVNFDAKLSRSETRDRSKAPAEPAYRALPGTRAEIDAVRQSFASRFPDGGVTILRQDAATKDRFIGEGWRHRYLHLATHGFIASESVSSAASEGSDGPSLLISELEPKSVGKPPGLLSGVAFAGVNRASPLGGDNGILTAQEAAELNLQQAELVVLSACDTGLGRVAGLEGVLGLQRSFQVAGARTVVASLWSVEDSATRTLMGLFYRNLWEKKLPKGEALRQAQIEMIHNYRFDAASRQVVDLRGGGKRIDDPEARRSLEEQLARLKQSGEPLPPFFWAAFVLSGDWR